MDTDHLFMIWKEGNKKIFSHQKTSKKMITQILDKKTHKTLKYINFNLIFHWTTQLIALILISMNFVGYKSNPGILWALVVQLGITLGVIFYGIYVFIKFRDTNNYSENLMSLITKQLRFFKTYYEAWIILTALTVLILIFNINILIDNMNGHYPINKVGFFVVVNIMVFFFIYATQKINILWRYKSLSANLQDLKNGMLEQSLKIERSQKSQLWFWVFLAILGLILFLIGAIQAFR